MTAPARTVLMHYIMVELPLESHAAAPVCARRRLRLLGNSVRNRHAERNSTLKRGYHPVDAVGKDIPHCSVSEPVKPIVYSHRFGTPANWRPLAQAAGLKIVQCRSLKWTGFKNADRPFIRMSLSPGDESRDWSPRDLRHSVVRWVPSADIDIIIPYTIVIPARRDYVETLQLTSGPIPLNRLRDDILVDQGPSARPAGRRDMPFSGTILMGRFS